MAAVTWTHLSSPGDVGVARASADATVVVVITWGGHVYLRRRAGAEWAWERVGTPPTSDLARDATVLSADPFGAVTLAVVGDDVQVWLYRHGAGPGSWTALGGPPKDPDEPNFVDGGRIAATTRQGAGAQPTLVVTSASKRPWLRQGIDPDGTWFPLSADDMEVAELASVLASVAPGAEPQQHIFAIDSGPALKVAVRESSVWKWIDPAGPPPNGQGDALSATSIRGPDGRLQACALVQTGSGVSMLTGSGRDWRWVDLGAPSPGPVGTAVLADKGPDPRPGDEPVVVARDGHNIWTRSLSGAWRDRGTTPGDTDVVVPTTAFEVGATTPQRSVWTTGVSWRSDLWTFEADETGVRWERHGHPGSVTAVVGAFTDAPVEGVIDSLPLMAFAVDEHGALWECRFWGSPADGFHVASESWTYHGPPAAAVTSAAGVGVHTAPGAIPRPGWAFVVGSDGHLWARTRSADTWTWVDHGAPPGTSIESGVAPIADPAEQPIVHVLADDGRLWMRSRSGSESRWSDRGSPPGELVFATVGAAALATAAGPLPVAVVITADGHLWSSVPDGSSFRWSDVGTPNPTEKVVAGIGVEVVGPATVEVAAVGAPSGQVWTVRWTPGGAPQWTARGRPADAGIQATVGTMRDPAHADGCLAAVIGNDDEIWVLATAGPSPGWSRWDPRFPSTTILAAKVGVLLDRLPCSVVLDNERRVQVVTPAVG